MIWLTWRQLRLSAAAAFAALAVFAALLALTGPGIADDYAAGIAGCGQGGCEDFIEQFFNDHQRKFLALNGLMLILPALLGVFLGAPLVARELELGTHRLVWNQSITRKRWLAVKLVLTGLVAAAVAGLGSLALHWWAGPLDKVAVDDFPRMESPLFDTRGIVPLAYTVFAFVLGVTIGLLVRRTLAAMALTLAVFVLVQIAIPQFVRPYLLPTTTATVDITPEILGQFNLRPGTAGSVRIETKAPDPNSWVVSSDTIDRSGRTVGVVPVNTNAGPCAPLRAAPGQCIAEVRRLGYRQRVTYLPSSRFWALQWAVTGVYGVLALSLAGFCFWRIRRA